MDIRILNKNVELQGLVDDYKSFFFTKKFNKVGDFQLVIDNLSESSALLQRGNLVMVEKDTSKVGIITGINIKQDTEGKDIRTVTGKTLGIIISQRVTYPTNQFDTFRADTESVLRHYIDENITNPANESRKIPQFIQSDNKNQGQEIKWQTRFQNLLDEIEVISDLTKMGWEVKLDLQNRQYVFSVYQGQDKTMQQIENHPVLFSEDHGSIAIMDYTESDYNEKNMAFVATTYPEQELPEEETPVEETPTEETPEIPEPPADPFEDVVVYEVGETTGLDRKEVYMEVNVTEDEYIDAPQLGLNKLSDFKEVVNIECEVFEDSLKYGTDYNVGDIVTVLSKRLGVHSNQRIYSITEIYEADQKAITATLGEPVPSLSERLKLEFKQFDFVKGM